MTETQASDHTPRWGMVIDVNRCVGCQTCTIACKHWNDTQPDVQWRKVIDVETGSFPDVERVFLVTGCQHCAEPPCVPVCPTGATKQREDGLVTMDYDICIGCAYCAVSCPYQARTIVHDHHWYYDDETEQERYVRHPEREGVAQKCTFCVDKLEEAQERGLTPGEDLEVTPACAAACIASAITFGDFNDPASNVSRLVDENPYFQMHAHLGTDPQIKYLYETPTVPGREPDAIDLEEERLADPENPLVGKRQTFWDWRAAMNWCFGGLSSGFAVMTALAWAMGLVSLSSAADLFVGAAALMAVGLFFVWLKIGRKLRAWRAIFRPQSSWMTRELYAAALFYPAMAAAWWWQSPAALIVAALAAGLFLVCQAKILHMAKGIPAWRVPLIPPMIVASGLLEGTGLLAVAAAVPGFGLSLGPALPVALVVLAAFGAIHWHVYRTTAREKGIVPLARGAIQELTWPLHVGGHLVPAVLAAAVLAGLNAPLVLGAAGAAAIAGGFYWKFGVIVRAGFQQGFALERYPQRGSGARAAPSLAAMAAE